MSILNALQRISCSYSCTGNPFQGLSDPSTSPAGRSSTDHPARCWQVLHLAPPPPPLQSCPNALSSCADCRPHSFAGTTAEASEAATVASEEEHLTSEEAGGHSYSVAKPLHGRWAGRPQPLPAMSLSKTRRNNPLPQPVQTMLGIEKPGFQCTCGKFHVTC